MSPKRWLRQWVRSRAVFGVTCQEFGSGSSRHRSTRWRTLPMNADRSYCCASVPSACAGRVEEDPLLLDPLLLLRLRDRRDERDLAALGKDPVRRLPARVELQVAGRVLVRRVQDRLLEECRVHLASACPTAGWSRARQQPCRLPPAAERARRPGPSWAIRHLRSSPALPPFHRSPCPSKSSAGSLEPLGYPPSRPRAFGPPSPPRTPSRWGPIIARVRFSVRHLHRTMHSRSSTLRR